MAQGKDSWGTPHPVYDYFNKRYNFAADMAADQWNHKHPIYFDKAADSLKFKWKPMVQLFTGRSDWVWLNPPYSDPYPWVKKVVESQQDGLGTVMLIKADYSPAWYMLADQYVTEVQQIIGGRLRHIPPAGIKESSNNFCSMVMIFDPADIGAGRISKLNIKDF